MFEDIGLMFQPPDQPLPVAYDATSPDAVTIVSTSGDGVHFSATRGARGAIIVMTAPMQFDQPNVAVGATLREFLSLGCASGYCGLEQLAYDYASTAAAFVGEATVDDPTTNQDLALLRALLGLTARPDPRSRLDELQGFLPRNP